MTNKLALTLGLLTLATLKASAAPVTFGAPTVISGDSDVFNGGTNDFAFYYDNNGDVTPQTPPVVNGVSFTNVQTAPAGGTLTSTSGLYSAAVTAGAGGNLQIYGNYDAPGTPPFSNLSASYQRVLQGAIYDQVDGNTTASSSTLTLGGLTLGTKYEFELFVEDARSSGLGARAESLTAGNTSGTLLFGNGNGTAGNGGGATGDFILGTFTADATTQAIAINAITGGGSTVSQINALVLSTVPEPSPLGLIGVAAAGLAFLFRRRLQASV